jgi:hypothetical protein
MQTLHLFPLKVCFPLDILKKSQHRALFILRLVILCVLYDFCDFASRLALTVDFLLHLDCSDVNSVALDSKGCLGTDCLDKDLVAVDCCGLDCIDVVSVDASFLEFFDLVVALVTCVLDFLTLLTSFLLFNCEKVMFCLFFPAANLLPQPLLVSKIRFTELTAHFFLRLAISFAFFFNFDSEFAFMFWVLEVLEVLELFEIFDWLLDVLVRNEYGVFASELYT